MRLSEKVPLILFWQLFKTQAAKVNPLKRPQFDIFIDGWIYCWTLFIYYEHHWLFQAQVFRLVVVTKYRDALLLSLAITMDFRKV